MEAARKSALVSLALYLMAGSTFFISVWADFPETEIMLVRQIIPENTTYLPPAPRKVSRSLAMVAIATRTEFADDVPLEFDACMGTIIRNNLVLTSPICEHPFSDMNTEITSTVVYLRDEPRRRFIKRRVTKSESLLGGWLLHLDKPFPNYAFKPMPVITDRAQIPLAGQRVYMASFGNFTLRGQKGANFSFQETALNMLSSKQCEKYGQGYDQVCASVPRKSSLLEKYEGNCYVSVAAPLYVKDKKGNPILIGTHGNELWYAYEQFCLNGGLKMQYTQAVGSTDVFGSDGLLLPSAIPN